MSGVTESGLTKTAEDLWPGRVFKKKGEFWVELKNETIGPFESKRAAENHVLGLQDKIMGWEEPKWFVGIVFQQGEGKFYVDRWRKEDGPFATRELAEEYKAKLIQDHEDGVESTFYRATESGQVVVEEKPRPLHQDEIPAVMSLMMDRLGITRFEFTTKELMEVEGRINLDQADLVRGSYLMTRVR